MKKGIVTRHDFLWQGHPDVAFFQDKIYVVYRESDRHTTARKTKIKLVCSTSLDFSYFGESIIIDESLDRFNCPRLSVIDDALYIICDQIKASKQYIIAENKEENTKVSMWRSYDGTVWKRLPETGITGIVPDRICQTDDGYLIATHIEKMWGREEAAENLKKLGQSPEDCKLKTLSQYVWHADDLEKGEWTRHVLAEDQRYQLCEGSIFQYTDGYACMMRENSGRGLPSLLSFSQNGTEWGNPKPTRLYGCHRPVCGALNSGNFLITYREAVHSHKPGYWAKNTLACLAHPKSFVKSIVLPLDHDNSTASDSGYTGWVQLPDDSIFVVNYITKEAPRPYIVWYRLTEDEF